MINAKKVEVVEPLTRIDLQLFSDDGGGVDGADTVDNSDNGADNIDTDGQDNLDSQDTHIDQSDDSQTKTVQDKDTNRAFAEMRRQKEAAEAKAKQVDDMIAAQYGETHGIYTLDQYNEAVAQQQAEEQRQQYIQQHGVDPQVVNQMVEKGIQNHPLMKQFLKQQEDQMIWDNFNSLKSEYPHLVKTPDDIPQEVFQKWNNGKSGLSLTDVYTMVNRKAIFDSMQQATAQKTLNNINNKQHIKGANGGVDIDTTTIPDDVLRMYKSMNPGKSYEEYAKHYKNSLK